MNKVIKETYYISEAERESLWGFFAASGKSLNEWAKKIGISKSYFSLVLSGKRALTDDLRQRFAKVGINFSK